jgi:hypothetical protein
MCVNAKYLNPWRDYVKVKEIWNELFSMSNVSYFLSWGWLDTWINSLRNRNVQIVLVAIYNSNNPVCAFFIGSQKIKRRMLIRSRCKFLNSTGNNEYDDICTEFNSILCKKDFFMTLEDIIRFIPDPWDEILLPGLDLGNFPNLYDDKILDKYKIIIDEDEAAAYVRLKDVRNSPNGYIALLGQNTRATIRKSYRIYEKYGKITQCDSKDIVSAMKIYDELVQLHQKTWTSRGYPGSFASEYFYDFHKQLIQKRFSYGEVQLVKITAGSETLGCLYNFISKGTVYFYQSGINYDFERAAKPGFVCFSEVINYNASLNHLFFNFMGGGYEYKRRLANNENRLVWVRIQKPLLKFKIEDNFKVFYKNLKSKYNTWQNNFTKIHHY